MKKREENSLRPSLVDYMSTSTPLLFKAEHAANGKKENPNGSKW